MTNQLITQKDIDDYSLLIDYSFFTHQLLNDYSLMSLIKDTH